MPSKTGQFAGGTFVAAKIMTLRSRFETIESKNRLDRVIQR